MVNVKLPLGTQIWQCLKNKVLVHIKLLCIISLLLIQRKNFLQLSYRENKPYIIYQESSLKLFYFFTIYIYNIFFYHHCAGILLGILFLVCNTLEPILYLAIRWFVRGQGMLL